MKNSITNHEFKQILFTTKSLRIRDLLFYYKKNSEAGISFIISGQRGGAVMRNLLKRRCRSLFNYYKNNNLQNMKIIVKPVKKLKNNYSWKELKQSFEDFSCKLKL